MNAKTCLWMSHEHFVIWFLDVNDARAKVERLCNEKLIENMNKQSKSISEMEHLIKQTFF